MIDSKILKESLYSVMNLCMIKEIPEPLDPNDNRIWMKGIAKVHKCNNSVNWAVVINDGTGKPVVEQDFGSMSVIKSIDEVHPFRFLSGEWSPKLNKRKDIIQYLTSHGEDEEYLNSLIYNDEATKEEKDKNFGIIMSMVIRHTQEDNDKKEEYERSEREANKGRENQGTEEEPKKQNRRNSKSNKTKE